MIIVGQTDDNRRGPGKLLAKYHGIDVHHRDGDVILNTQLGGVVKCPADGSAAQTDIERCTTLLDMTYADQRFNSDDGGGWFEKVEVGIFSYNWDHPPKI